MDVKQCISSIVEIKYGTIPGPDINAMPRSATYGCDEESGRRALSGGGGGA